MLKSIIVLSIFIVVSTLQIGAQSLPANDRIPDDLLITLKTQEGWGGSYSEMTITANGDISYVYRGSIAVPVAPDLFVTNRKSKKAAKYLKPKLSPQKLRSLIAEFEKLKFFKFGKDFPLENNSENASISDQATEVISIRINGQTKEVSNYLGDNLRRTRLLRDLAEKIRGSGIWNYENGKIPSNFEVWYRTTQGDDIHQDFKIKSNGKVIKSFYTSVPLEMEKGKFVPRFDRSKTVAKLSKAQLKQLINEFEKVGFSTFRYSTLSQYDGCSTALGSSPEKRTHVNVQINRVAQMYASLYANCNPKPETNAAKFEYMANVIEILLKSSGALRDN